METHWFYKEFSRPGENLNGLKGFVIWFGEGLSNKAKTEAVGKPD